MDHRRTFGLDYEAAFDGILPVNDEVLSAKGFADIMHNWTLLLYTDNINGQEMEIFPIKHG